MSKMYDRELDDLKIRIEELERENAQLTRARDDHFRNAQRLARRNVEIEAKLRAIKTICHTPTDALVEYGARLLFCHEERWPASEVNNATVNSWFGTTSDSENPEDQTCAFVCNDMRKAARVILDGILPSLLDTVDITKELTHLHGLADTEDTFLYLAKWVERGIYSGRMVTPMEALECIAYHPGMPWTEGRWDVDHKPYAAQFYKDFPKAR